MNGNHLDGMMAFVAVAERRSFTAAAASLRVTRSAISQSIRTLEKRIGVPLFARTTRDVALTEAGEMLYLRVGPAVRAIGEAMETVGAYAGRPSGLLRLNVPRVAIPTILAPLLPDFARAFPEVVVEVFAEDRLVNIVEAGFDAGIRLGELVERDMVSVRLSPPARFLVVGSPAYLRDHGRPASPAALAGHRCINFRMSSRGNVYRWEFERDGEEFAVSVDGSLIVNDVDLAIRAAADGLGLAYVFETLAAPFLADGALETVLEGFAAQSPGFFLYFPARVQVMPKLRAFIDFAVARR
ncbi:LysR family transcriptional regulator [Azospirillum sp. A39]|uniref:LysR family transcriptional regulator n=1 Tax=Azospirillum sp. A39 TaxID=3462279 RepID=UPI004045948E